MSSESTPSPVLPETSAILALLRELDVHPRTLPETHDILALLHQLHGTTPAVSPPPAPQPAAELPATAPPLPKVVPAAAPELSFGTLFDADSEAVAAPEPPDEAAAVQSKPLAHSVRAFFDAVSWDPSDRVERLEWDHDTTDSPAAPESASASPQDPATAPQVVTSSEPQAWPSLHGPDVSVRTFFNAVPWDGTPQVSATPAQPARQQAESEDEFPIVVETSAEPRVSQTSHADLTNVSVRAFFARVHWDRSSGGTPDPNNTAEIETAAAISLD